MYTLKTTVVTLSCWYWTEESRTTTSFNDLVNAIRAVAVHMAQLCHMDIISLSPCPAQSTLQCEMIAVYINNGVSLAEIRAIMQSEINNKPPTYWMIQDIYEWQGMLDVVITARSVNEEWD